MRRWLLALLSLALSLPIVLGIAAAGLLFTTAGARWVADWALEREPRLALSVTGGSLAGGLQLEQLSWSDRQISFSAAAAEVAWTPECLLARRLCVNALRLQSPRLVVRPGESAEAAPPARIELPVAVRLDLLQLSDAEFELPGASGRLPLLQASGRFEDGVLALDWARIHGLRLALEEAPGAATEPIAAAAESPPRLPAIALPFELQVEGFLLEDAELVVARRHWPIASLTLNLGWRGSELDLRGVQLDLPQVSAGLRGKLRLEGDYPLQMTLQGRIQPPEPAQPVEIMAKLGGSVADLSFELSSQGGIGASANGRLRPLQPRLPFTLQARWQALGWPPLIPEPRLSLRDGSLTAEGDLGAYSLSLNTRIGGALVPEGHWRLQAAGDRESLRVQALSAETLGGRLSGEGRLAWSGDFSWQARLSAEGIEPERFWPQYPGRLGGSVSSEGAVTADGWRMQTRTSGISGRLRGYPLSVTGGVRHQVDGSWGFQQLRLSSGDNRIAADGRLGKSWNLDGEFELPRLNALLPEIRGAARGRFKLGGPLRTPDVELGLDAENLAFQDYAAADLALRARIRRLGEGPDSHLEWQASGVRVGERLLGKLDGRLDGSRARHRLTARMDGPELDANVVLAGRLAKDLDWTGRLLEARLAAPPSLRWQLAEPVAMHWRQRRRNLELASHCWSQQEARLCLTQPATIGRGGELALSLRQFRLQWLAPWLPEEAQWRGPLTADARLSWQPGAPPRLSLQASSEDGSVRLSQEDEEPLVLGYRRLSAQVELRQDGLSAEFGLQSESLGSGRLLLRTQPGQQPRPLAGEVDLRGLRLDVLKTFLPQLRTVAGSLSAQGRLGGDLRQPQFFGELRLADGALSSVKLPLELRDVQLTAQLRGSQASLTGSFRAAEGSGSLDGAASWREQDWSLALNVRGDGLLVNQAPIASLRVDPDLRIRIRPKQIAVDGRIVIPRGQITLESLPEGAVEVSDDVVVVRGPGSAAAAEPMPGWSVTMNVEVVLGDKVAIRGQGLSGRLGGNLMLRQRAGGVPEAAGELRIEDGLYEAYGQKLKIRQGQLIFAGPVAEPALNIEAVREVGDVVAGIRVEGSPQQPQASLFSEPGMPQEDILSYIIRGRPLDSGGTSASEQQLLAQAALSLGIFGGEGVASSLAEELGVEDFELGTSGEGETTQFELSGYLNPDLYIRYGIGVFAPVNTLTLRYRLSDRFFVEAVSSLERAIDFLYEFRF